MVFIGEFSNVQWKFYIYSDIKMDIGERKYYNTYIGHQINRMKSVARDKLFKMYELNN